VRRGGIKEENDQRWRSLIEGDGGKGGSKSIAPGDGFRWLRGQAASLGRGESGGGLQEVEWRVK
jgi:hypothetical protein